MPSVNVKIAPAIMDWILQRTHGETLPSEMHKQLLLWKSGIKDPTFNQVQNVSKAIGIPFGYFFLQTPPNEQNSLLNYRTIDSLEIAEPSRNLLDTIHDMENVQEWMHDYMVSTEARPVSFVHFFAKEKTVGLLATLLRKQLGLSETWYQKSRDAEDSFKKIRALISQLGILVMTSGIVENNTHRKLNIEEFRAFTLIDDYAPLIFINSNDSKSGKLFSLLHELVHIGFGNNDFYNDRSSGFDKVSALERLCNAVAAEILVPQKQFLDIWETEGTNSPLQEKIHSIACSFRCGNTVIARKALDNMLISKDDYSEIAKTAIENFNKECEKRKDSGSHGGNFYTTTANRIDHRFFAALQSSLNEDRTPFSVVLRLSNTNRNTFDKLANNINGRLYD